MKGKKKSVMEVIKNPEGGYFLGVEFNRNAIHCVALDFTGKLIYDADI